MSEASPPPSSPAAAAPVAVSPVAPAAPAAAVAADLVAADLRFVKLRTSWSNTAGKPITSELIDDAVKQLSREIVLAALKSSNQNINLALSNLFTNSLNPENGCPPILGLVLDDARNVDELSGVKREAAVRLHEALAKDDLLLLRLLRDQLVAIAHERVDEVKEAKSPIFSRQASNPLVQSLSPQKCLACWDTYETGVVVLRACGHTFCYDCLDVYVWAKATDASPEHVVCCPMADCKKAISQREMIALVGLEKFEKLDRRALENIISHDKTFHMCATPDCAYIVSWDGGSDGLPWMVCPKCGHERCLKCGTEPYHKGKSCQEVLEETDETKLNQDLFKRLNYRICPQCKTPIEKIDGCNKMLCFCGCKFCSECLMVMPTCSHVYANHGYLHPITKRFVAQNQATPDLKFDSPPKKQ
eukprot:TRINITY_DN437_c0_g1_i8.p1 TRINITY_DN437_c0_g1~~TRINITY_DN437_c0_g1_i8.p1  ORF type:complete len:417 (-),score=97.55 TRINITY_DN437_c0_g1_i8:56-1306(-)